MQMSIQLFRDFPTQTRGLCYLFLIGQGETIQGAETGEKGLLSFFTDARDIFQDGMKPGPAAQFLLIGDGEAVRLVAQAEQKQQFRRCLRQDNGFCKPWYENAFRVFEPFPGLPGAPSSRFFARAMISTPVIPSASLAASPAES